MSPIQKFHDLLRDRAPRALYLNIIIELIVIATLIIVATLTPGKYYY